MSKLQSLVEDFGKALARLEEALNQEKTDIVRDSAIKRFELVFDLGWKTLKTFLAEYHTVQCVSPRSCFKKAFSQGVIEYDRFWVEATGIRNYTVHTYSELLAESIYKKLPTALAHFKHLYASITAKKEEYEKQ